eukprot:1663115-Pleurochrysis_carterae.AAC.1
MPHNLSGSSPAPTIITCVALALRSPSSGYSLIAHAGGCRLLSTPDRSRPVRALTSRGFACT